MATFTLTAEPGKQETVVVSQFDAPRELVFKALTSAEHIPNWWGPAYLTTTIDKFEARPGGLWRFVQKDAEGGEYAFHGVYHEVSAPERVIYTFEWEGMPGHVLMETIILEASEGGTRMIDQLVYQSVADRDGMLQTGMADGTADSLKRLEEVVMGLAKR
jgi:uncharacterized protein YndB with AHSA1/START domain